MKTKRTVQKIFSILCVLILLIGCCSVLLACQPKHTCQNVCQDCGKCLNSDCSETTCVDKCLGHIVCDSPCAKCGACNGYTCDKTHDSAPCSCGYPANYNHLCTNMCNICGYCANNQCEEAPCVTKKCPGHDKGLQLSEPNEPTTEYVYTELVAEQEESIKQAFCDFVNKSPDMNLTIEDIIIVEYYGTINGKQYLAMSWYPDGVFGMNNYYIDGVLLIGDKFHSIYVYDNGHIEEIDTAYANKEIAKDDLLVLSHYIMGYRYIEYCTNNEIAITYPLLINVIARYTTTSNYPIVVYNISQKEDNITQTTPKLIETRNILCDTVTQEVGVQEVSLFAMKEYSYYYSLSDLNAWQYDYWLINEYYMLYISRTVTTN